MICISTIENDRKGLVAGAGFEPTVSGYEPNVLPLHYPAIRRSAPKGANHFCLPMFVLSVDMVNDMSYRVSAKLQVVQGFIFSLNHPSRFDNLKPRLNQKVGTVHYYQFNIGDYSSHTSRLSVWEDCAYRRLLDLYYLNERPLNGCSKDVAREIGMLDSLGDVEYVLTKFFTQSGDKWTNKRCDAEIKAYQNKKESASKAGKASAKARQDKASERTLNEKSTDVQPNIKHKPLTINHKDQNTYVETKVSTCPISKIVDLYHKTLPELPTMMKITKTREGYIKQRWREDMPKLENWEIFFDHIKQSKFLMGKASGFNGKPPFRADLEWITKPANFAKIAEGKYHVR